MPAYNYNLGNNNTQTAAQAMSNVGMGGVYSRFNYNAPPNPVDVSAYQQMNTYGGQNVGQQQGGGAYYGQVGGQNPFPQSAGPLAPYQGIGGTLANPYSQYQGHSNFAYPGETGGQAYRRQLAEWEGRGMSQLPAYQDAQRRFTADGSAVGLQPGQAGYGASAGGAAGTGAGQWNNPFEALLRQQRELRLQDASDQLDYYNSPAQLEIQDSWRNRMTGADSPYPALTSAQLAESADAHGAAFDTERQMALRYGANSSQSGGGAEYNAIRNAQRQATAGVAGARPQIQSRNELLDDQRSERGLAGATAYGQSVADNAWRARQSRIDQRGRFQIVPGTNLFGGGIGGGGDYQDQSMGTRGAVSYGDQSGLWVPHDPYVDPFAQYQQQGTPKLSQP